MTIPSPVRRILHALGIDRAVGYLLLTYGWNFLAQPITALMIVTFLTQREQDFYYTFASIIGIQTFFELGLVAAAQQFASHEAAHLHWTADRTLDGDPEAKSRLASLFRQSVAWYTAIVAVLWLVLLPTGWLILRKGGSEIAWQFPWTWAAVIAAVSLLPTPTLIILNGTGRIADVIRANGIQRVIFSAGQWIVLAAGGGLLSWPVAQTGSVMFLAIWLYRVWRPTFADLWRYPRGGPAIHWWQEIWPFQWRVALSTPFIFLTTQFFTPVLFWYAAEGEAGRMGLCMAASNTLVGAASAWILSRMPQFGQLIARREWDRLDDLFGRSFRQSLLMLVSISAAVWAVAAVLQGATGDWLGPRLLRIGDRLLSSAPFGVVLLGGFVQLCGLSMSYYLRRTGGTRFQNSSLPWAQPPPARR